MYSFIKKPPFFLGLLNTLASLLAYFIFVGQPIWGTNDDVFMSGIAAGVWDSNQPSSYLFFIHEYYGRILKYLYSWKLDVPWYGLSFISVVGLSILILNYSILRLQKHSRFFLIVTVATIATILPSLWHLQFTIVAGLATIAGEVLLVSLLIKKPLTLKSSTFGITLSISLLLVGSMIRFASFLMVTVLFVPFTIVVVIRIMQSNRQRKLRQKQIIFFLLGIVLAGISVIGLQIINYKQYSYSPEWKEWFSLNRAKSEFIDFKTILYNERSRQIFEAVGWSQTDFNMIMTWQYIDPVRYGPEKFIYVVNALQIGIPDRKNSSVNFDILISKVGNMVRRALSIRSLVSLFPFAFLVALLTIRWQKWNVGLMITIFFTSFFLLSYLFLGLNRAPLRLLLLIWMCALWMVMLVATNFDNSVRTTVGLRKSYPKRTWAILTIMFLIFCFKDFSHARDINKRGIKAQNNLIRQVEKWNNKLPRHSIIYNIGSAFPYEAHLPLMSFDYLRSIKGNISAGWSNQSPLQRKIIANLGLSDDFYGSLAQKKNVYLVNREEVERRKKEQKILQDFYKENYDLNLTLIVDPGLPSLSRMIFQKN